MPSDTEGAHVMLGGRMLNLSGLWSHMQHRKTCGGIGDTGWCTNDPEYHGRRREWRH